MYKTDQQFKWVEGGIAGAIAVPFAAPFVATAISSGFDVAALSYSYITDATGLSYGLFNAGYAVQNYLGGAWAGYAINNAYEFSYRMNWAQNFNLNSTINNAISIFLKADDLGLIPH